MAREALRAHKRTQTVLQSLVGATDSGNIQSLRDSLEEAHSLQMHVSQDINIANHVIRAKAALRALESGTMHLKRAMDSGSAVELRVALGDAVRRHRNMPLLVHRPRQYLDATVLADAEQKLEQIEDMEALAQQALRGDQVKARRALFLSESLSTALPNGVRQKLERICKMSREDVCSISCASQWALVIRQRLLGYRAVRAIF